MAASIQNNFKRRGLCLRLYLYKEVVRNAAI